MKPEAGTMPYSYFFIVHITIGSNVHSRPLNSLEHCICTTTVINIRPDRDSNLIPPGYKPQSIRVSRRGRRFCPVYIYVLNALFFARIVVVRRWIRPSMTWPWCGIWCQNIQAYLCCSNVGPPWKHWNYNYTFLLSFCILQSSDVFVLTLPLNAMRPFNLFEHPSPRGSKPSAPKFQTLPKIMKVVHVEQT